MAGGAQNHSQFDKQTGRQLPACGTLPCADIRGGRGLVYAKQPGKPEGMFLSCLDAIYSSLAKSF